MRQTILITTLIAGSLDIAAACLQSYCMSDVMPSTVLKYIASGVFGKAAFSGGSGMVFMGLLFHFMIAFACTVCYFLLYPKLNFLKRHWLPGSLLIGIIAWVVTTRIIIPMSQITPPPFNASKALMAVGILVVCIGVPVAYSAHKFYGKTEG